MNNWHLISCGLRLARDGYRQYSFINRFLRPLVYKQCAKLNHSLSPTERKKALFYYPMYVVMACAQMYVAIKGRSLTREETKRLTLIGSMTTLCDDLIDENQWTREQIFHLLSNDVKENTLPTKAQLLLALNKELQQFWLLTDKYLTQLKIALEWQAVSLKQLDASISLEEIVHICRNKNGNTSLMFASLLDENWTKEELKFIYQSAMVGQLTNDSFDIYFDTQNHIKTYFNTTSTIKNAKEFFTRECETLHQYVMSTDNRTKDKLATIRRMSVFHGFALTAIDHLQQTENKYDHPIDWKNIPRREMVTDMQLYRNRIRVLKNIKKLEICIKVFTSK